MKNTLSVWQLAGLTFSVILGTLLHFLYPCTRSILLSPISAVNESTWEHMKILFFPMLFFALLQYPFFKTAYPNFWKIKTVGTLLGTLLIPILFYTYNGAFGTSPDWLNVAFFFLSAGLAYYTETKLLQHANATQTAKASNTLSLLLLLAIAVLFGVFTFYPPHLPLFLDPITNGYGIQ